MLPVLKIEFTEIEPEAIPVEDDRTFLFVVGGIVFDGTHYHGRTFKTFDGVEYRAEAWREYKEVIPVKI